MKKLLPLLLLVAGCTTTDDDRLCLDWNSSIEVVKECTPLYGNIICVTKEKPRYQDHLAYRTTSLTGPLLAGPNGPVGGVPL